jgi:ketosteroid isomerase-like protein
MTGFSWRESMSTYIHPVVKRYADAWAAHDLQTIIDCYHDEIVFRQVSTALFRGGV